MHINCSAYEKLSKNKSCTGCIALHGMAYYIFLKSLRNLEEFRKNPHIKIPPKSPSTNFQSLGKFRYPIFNSEIIFPCIRPGQPCGPFGLWPSQPTGHAVPRRPKSLRLAHPARASVASSQEIHFPFRFTPSRAGRLSLVSLSTGPHLSDVSSPPPRPLSFVPSDHPAPPDLRPRDAQQDNYPAP
jgi:hypothetical protein